MGKSLADAMTAQPGPDSLAYWLAPLKGYWDRQGRMANEGLQMADQGAQAVQAGNMGGLAGMLLGPAAYIGSPVSALFPERSEVEAATDIPEWSKPWLAGGLETMAIMAPGPKGAKGVGRIKSLTAEEVAADQAVLDALDAADKGPDVSPATVQGWIKPKVTMESIMRDELAQAVAAGDTATADKLRKELRGMGYAVE